MKLLTIFVSAIGLALLACSADDNAAPPHSHNEAINSGHGSQIILTLDELKEASELVVRGSPTAVTAIQKSVVSSDYPADLRSLHAEQVHDIDKITFRVDEYYKGTGPKEITIMVSTSKNDLFGVNVGNSYVLYLFQSESAEGKAYWDQAYLVQGLAQGVWTVDGENATRQIGDVRSRALTKFRDAPSDG